MYFMDWSITFQYVAYAWLWISMYASGSSGRGFQISEPLLVSGRRIYAVIIFTFSGCTSCFINVPVNNFPVELAACCVIGVLDTHYSLAYADSWANCLQLCHVPMPKSITEGPRQISFLKPPLKNFTHPKITYGRSTNMLGRYWGNPHRRAAIVGFPQLS